MAFLRIIGVLFAMLAASSGDAQTHVAVINDPDGYANVRAEPSTSAKAVARINDGERFITVKGEEWWEVYAPSGPHGYMHGSRIKVLEGEPMPRLNYRKESILLGAREVPEFQSHAKEYPKLVEQALRGTTEGLANFYSAGRTLQLDGAGAEIHTMNLWEVFHAIGDKRFAEFLAGQPTEFMEEIGRELRSDFVTYPIDKPDEYLQRHFPATWKVIGTIRLEADGE